MIMRALVSTVMKQYQDRT